MDLEDKISLSSTPESDANYNQEGGLFGFLFRKVKSKVPGSDPLLRIHDLTPNTYCAISTQRGFMGDGHCEARVLDMENTKDFFQRVSMGHPVPGFLKDRYMRWFIDTITCCADTYMTNEILRETYIKPTVKTVAISPDLTNRAK